MTTCAVQDVPGRECLWCAERSDTVDFSQSIKASVVGCDLLAGGRLMCPAGLSGATVLLGVDGTAHGERRRARCYSGNVNVPMMIIAVGSGESIGRALPELGALLRRPLVTLERVRVCKRDGALVERPHALPGTDAHGRPLWQKLMISTSEGSLHEGQPVHRAIVQRLRRSGARGAPALRGGWGFAGDHPPGATRLFQLGRRVPVLTVVVDAPERIAESFAVVDELTAEQRRGEQRDGPGPDHRRRGCPARVSRPGPLRPLTRSGTFARGNPTADDRITDTAYYAVLRNSAPLHRA